MKSRASALWRRLVAAWRALSAEQRLACGAALALILSMFLPWYDKSAIPRSGAPYFAHDTMSAWGAMSFAEATVLLAALGVAGLMFLRGERRARPVLPGGDAVWVLGAGGWCLLVLFIRALARPGAGPTPGATVGIHWGFFVAFVIAGVLGWAGLRLRAAETAATASAASVVDEPVIPDEEPRVRRRSRTRAGARAAAPDGAPIPGQMSFEEPGPPDATS